MLFVGRQKRAQNEPFGKSKCHLRGVSQWGHFWLKPYFDLQCRPDW